tara:strand:- start:9398 stop:10141 length:744 start_codon:yes stop_codon:yes gene_type:complete
MRTYKASNIFHRVYDDIEELPQGIYPIEDWREAEIGDWVQADDGCYIQILRKGRMKTPRGKKKFREYVGTCTGTFMCNKNAKMDTSKRDNIWTISGRDTERVIFDRKDLTKCEILFVQFAARGVPIEDAYLNAFKTKNQKYAKEQSAKLVKTERIQKAMKEELKPVLEELGIDENYILENIKRVIETTEKDDTRLKAIFKLSDIMDLEEKNQTKVTQLSGAVFQGLLPEDYKGLDRPKEIKEAGEDE